MGGELKAGSSIHQNRKLKQHCVLMEVQRGAQCICQAEKIVASSFKPSVAL